jgi:RHS repeat-associated protein
LQRIDEEQIVSNTWTPSFYGYDGGGNVRTLTNSAGSVTDAYEYDAFGNKFTVSGNTPNNYLYHLYRGEQYDPDLGLYYLRARYYNPLTGRFMSRDPNDPQLLNSNGVPTNPKYLHKFLYANGDPVDGLDPTGRITVTKPTGTFGEALGEWAGIIQDISLKAFVITQVAIPVYLGSQEG